MADIFTAIMGIIAAFFGYIAYKKPKTYLEVFGARALILFKVETRITIVKWMGLVIAIIGLFAAIVSLVR
ncbi:hypothetical protein EPN87_04560 [archaeon]|nr:MAG: hypothetical protein EPN87_04560 [archaeon]